MRYIIDVLLFYLCVSGATVDVDAVNRLMHMHKAIVVWDYAAAAPHLPIGTAAHMLGWLACAHV